MGLNLLQYHHIQQSGAVAPKRYMTVLVALLSINFFFDKKKSTKPTKTKQQMRATQEQMYL